MKRIVLTIAALALLAAACGSGDVGDAGPVTIPLDETSTTTTAPTGDTTTPTTQPADDDPADQLFVELFFIKEGLEARSIIRAVDTPDVATNAIRELIEGPTPAEQDTELSTAIPADTLLLGLTTSAGLHRWSTPSLSSTRSTR
jgi:spore germination protein GerM